MNDERHPICVYRRSSVADTSGCYPKNRRALHQTAYRALSFLKMRTAADTALAALLAGVTSGTYDSGYIQPLDFFGDGPRVPLIVASPYSTGGRVCHS